MQKNRTFIQMIKQHKKPIYDVLSGKSEVRFGKTIQAITNYLRQSQEASPEPKGTKQFKEQEKQRLEIYIQSNKLWIDSVDVSNYVSEGAEQKVYLKDFNHVLKLNDSIYYNCWVDYFDNLLLHNFFFEDTAYKLNGFIKDNGVLYAVVEQVFVEITTTTNLANLKDFLAINGFANTRNNDYYNPELGIILEDLHDEIVLTKDGLLYFIDTVFYLTEEFWSEMKKH